MDLVLLLAASGIAGFLVGSHRQRRAARRIYLTELDIDVLPDLVVAHLHRAKILGRGQRLARLCGGKVKRALNALTVDDPDFVEKVEGIAKIVRRKLKLIQAAHLAPGEAHSDLVVSRKANPGA